MGLRCGILCCPMKWVLLPVLHFKVSFVPSSQPPVSALQGSEVVWIALVVHVLAVELGFDTRLNTGQNEGRIGCGTTLNETIKETINSFFMLGPHPDSAPEFHCLFGTMINNNNNNTPCCKEVVLQCLSSLKIFSPALSQVTC